MTRSEFESKSFEEVMEQLNEELDDITTYERLIDFAKHNIIPYSFAKVIINTAKNPESAASNRVKLREYYQDF